MTIHPQDVEKKIICLRNQRVILDRDVADLYHVKTKHVTQAVNRNPGKFPPGYIFQLTESEKQEVVTNCDHLYLPSPSSQALKFSSVLPHAFTEAGLYMLATILKSECATATTIAIIDTFTKVRQLSEIMQQLAQSPKTLKQKNTLAQKTEALVSELFMPMGSDSTEVESSIELNFAVVKLKYTRKKGRKK